MVKIKLITNFKKPTSFQKVKNLLLHHQNHSGSLNKIQAFNRCSVLPLKSTTTIPILRPHNPYKSSSFLFIKLIGTPLFLAIIPSAFPMDPLQTQQYFQKRKTNILRTFRLLHSSAYQGSSGCLCCQSRNLQPGLFQQGRTQKQ